MFWESILMREALRKSGYVLEEAISTGIAWGNVQGYILNVRPIEEDETSDE